MKVLGKIINYLTYFYFRAVSNAASASLACVSYWSPSVHCMWVYRPMAMRELQVIARDPRASRAKSQKHKNNKQENSVVPGITHSHIFMSLQWPRPFWSIISVPRLRDSKHLPYVPTFTVNASISLLLGPSMFCREWADAPLGSTKVQLSGEAALKTWL